MKLATYKDGSRDGQLVVVSRDLHSAHFAGGIAGRLQQVLDDWNFLSPQLEDLYTSLNQGRARHAFPFEPRQCMAPLPRAHRFADGAAYPSHGQRLRQALGQQAAEDGRSVPLPQPRASDEFLGPCDEPRFAAEALDIDFEAKLLVLSGDVAAGCSPAQALEGVRLLALACDWHARQHGGGEGLCAFAPVVVTPDELGEAWAGGRVHLKLQCALDDKTVGLLDAGADMRFHFGQLMAQLARHRRLRAGSLVGSGAISAADASQGHACVAEKRALEVIEGGEAKTPYLRFDDALRIDMKGRDGHSLFGAIEQRVAAAAASAALAESDA